MGRTGDYGAGSKGAAGVHVNAQCRTSLPDILAVGDCALHAHRFVDGSAVQLASVQNTTDQASAAAKAILGEDVVYEATP
jgi:3-phenylpropionate/trans-cinnamate dioxygenase ferredoxin reductase subunit